MAITRLEDSRPVKRTVQVRGWGKLVIQLAPEGLYLKKAGMRGKGHLFPFGAAFLRAVGAPEPRRKKR